MPPDERSRPAANWPAKDSLTDVDSLQEAADILGFRPGQRMHPPTPSWTWRRGLDARRSAARRMPHFCGCRHSDPLDHLASQTAVMVPGTEEMTKSAVVKAAAARGWQLWEVEDLVGVLTEEQVSWYLAKRVEVA